VYLAQSKIHVGIKTTYLPKEENIAVEVYGGRRGKSAHLALSWSEFVISWSPNVCHSRSDGTSDSFLIGNRMPAVYFVNHY
jgi:hypothetical protein